MAPIRWEDTPKPFLEHLEDLRLTVIKIGVTILAGMLASFFFVKPLFHLMYVPMLWAGLEPEQFLRVLGVADPFTLSLQVAFVSGAVLTFPLVLYFLAEFVVPALTPVERRSIGPVFAAGTLLFMGGVAFCYFVLLPQALRFFHDFGSDLGFRAEWTVQNYIGFVAQMLLALGLAFELPVVVLALAKLGLVDAAFLSRHRRHAVVVIVIFAAVITPTSDLFTLSLMAGPMWLLYEGSIAVAWWMERKARRAEEAGG